MKQFEYAKRYFQEHQVAKFVFFPVYAIVNIQKPLPNFS